MDFDITPSHEILRSPPSLKIESSMVEQQRRRSWTLPTTVSAFSTGRLRELQVGISLSHSLSCFILRFRCFRLGAWTFDVPITKLPRGRGILLDYARWAAAQTPPISYSCFSTHSIPFSALIAMCKYQNVEPKKGDLLFIRTGMIPEWESFSEEKKMAYAAQTEPQHAGVEASLETLEWLWDSGFAAVAGDAISWEVSRKILILGYNIHLSPFYTLISYYLTRSPWLTAWGWFHICS
jgi:hypothetical protein